MTEMERTTMTTQLTLRNTPFAIRYQLSAISHLQLATCNLQPATRHLRHD